MHHSIQAHHIGEVIEVPHQSYEVKRHSHFLEINYRVQFKALWTWGKIVHNEIHQPKNIFILQDFHQAWLF